MGRILAIDYGLKRTGIAVTDPAKIIASPLTTVRSHDLLDFLADYIKREEVERMVLGYPTDLSNRETNATPEVKVIKKKLEKKFPDKPIHLHDEKFTSKMALEAMITGGMKKKDRREKGNIDKISATLILQSFLESR